MVLHRGVRQKLKTHLEGILSDDLCDALLEGSSALEVLRVSRQKRFEPRLQSFVVCRFLIGLAYVRVLRDVPDRFPAPVTPLCCRDAISRIALSAKRISGSSSAATAANSAGDMSAYSGGAVVGSVPDNANAGVRYCACCSSKRERGHFECLWI